jgi:hypothetical protein
MKNREESRTDARQYRVNDILERIRGAVTAGSFEINQEMDYLQSEIIEGELGYIVEETGKSKRPGYKVFKISWY